VSSRKIDTAGQEAARGLQQLAVQAGYGAPRPPVELGAALYRGLAAINAAWFELANRRLNENFKLPRELAVCTSVPAMLSVYGHYCQAAVGQYQAGLGELQLITLRLLSEVPFAGLVPAGATAPWQHKAHASQSAAADGIR
jgi:hypothetical protein